jgi:hypothetical protein
MVISIANFAFTGFAFSIPASNSNRIPTNLFTFSSVFANSISFRLYFRPMIAFAVLRLQI